MWGSEISVLSTAASAGPNSETWQTKAFSLFPCRKVRRFIFCFDMYRVCAGVFCSLTSNTAPNEVWIYSLTSKHLMGKDVLGHWNPQTSKAMATSVLEKIKSKFKPEPDNGFCNITSHCWNNAKKKEFGWREKNQENKGDTRAASTHYQQHQTYKYQHFSFAFKVFCTIPVFKNQPQTRLAVLDGHGGLLLERESRSKNMFCLQPNSQPFWLFSLIDISNVSCATLSLPTISQSTDMLEQWTSKVIATNTLHRFLGIFKGRK